MSVQIDRNKANAQQLARAERNIFHDLVSAAKRPDSIRKAPLFPRSARRLILGHPFDAEPCKMRCYFTNCMTRSNFAAPAMRQSP